MIAEEFLELFDVVLKRIIKDVLRKTTESLKRKIPLFEPDKDMYFSKLRLKKGNFMAVLS